MNELMTFTGVMTVLTPFLSGAGGKIGEKIVESTTESNIWNAIKGRFTSKADMQVIQDIENKEVATEADIQFLRKRLMSEVTTHPDFGTELQAFFNLSSTGLVRATKLLELIRIDKGKFNQLSNDSLNAGIETEDSYDLMIARTIRRMEKNEKRFLDLLKNE